MRKAIILSIFLLFSFSRCTKDSSESRRTGNGTISCYINGKLWQNSESSKTIGGINSKSMSLLGGIETSYFSVSGRKWGESILYCMMAHAREDNEMEYVLDDSKGYLSYALDEKKDNTIAFRKNDIIYISKENEGWIKKTTFYYDSVNNVTHYEGTFEATLYNQNDPTDILYITDGKFND